MNLKLIVAHSINGVIGRDGDMPWHLPTDLSHFKRATEGHTVVMGRKTFESIGRPLPHRDNIVLSRRASLAAAGVEHYSDVADLKSHLNSTVRSGRDVYIIGGEQVYSHFLPMTSEIYLTLVDAVIDGDAFFPRLTGSWHVHLIAEHAEKPNGPLRGPWYPHRMYHILRA